MAYRCSSCKTTKDWSEYYRCRSNASGYQYKCKACSETAKKERGRSTNDFLYGVWSLMMRRCYGSTKDDAHYIERKITVCKRWHSYQNFKSDMESTFEVGLTLDRTNNDKGYSPENCRWATRREQAYNRRSNRLITFRGVTKHLSIWADELGIKRTTLSERIDSCGWSIEKAFTTPVGKRG